MTRKLSENALGAVSLFATVVCAIEAFRHLVVDARSNELQIASFTILAAAAAGGISEYIARIAKSLPRRQRIFISYSREEKDRARELRRLFEKRGAKVWFDENELQPGSDLRSSIATAIESSNFVVALMSNRIGGHLKAELRAATERHVPVLAIVTGDALAAEIFENDENVRVLRQDGSLEDLANAILAAR